MTDLYLDYNGSTPVHPDIVDVVSRTLTDTFGNASAKHPSGVAARAAIQEARATIARGIGALPASIWFTSGGTESNNWALQGVLAARPERRHLVVSPIEHWSVRRTAEWLGRHGYDVTFVPVGESGAVRVDDVKSALREDTAVVSVMLANNETGVLQPASEIAAACRERGIAYHCDAVAALGKVPVDVEEIGCDLLSLSSHKMYAPKGCGVLYVREGAALPALIHGCGQQDGMRSGTENTTGVLAFAKAFELLEQGAFPSAKRLAELRDRLADRITTAFPDAKRNGSGTFLPNTLSMSFPGVRGFELQAALGVRGVHVSAGSAAAGASPSHVLLAMGFSSERASSTIRFSLGSGTDDATIDTTIDALAACLVRS